MSDFQRQLRELKDECHVNASKLDMLERTVGQLSKKEVEVIHGFALEVYVMVYGLVLIELERITRTVSDLQSVCIKLKQNKEELRLWEIRQRKTTPSSDRHRDPIIQFPVTSHGGGVNGPPDPYRLPSTEPPSECPVAINVDLDTEANSKTLTRR
ncbi:hypothetical protein Bca4012_031007 [Brassica carinata]|uniref:Uncharacterized protein n=1 Tax=Brassica carinata TaxID=52824 RepID=A0A8X7URF7_BRACI|nr:hypothetical protein Bca52824_047723 [Brassica carinata]